MFPKENLETVQIIGLIAPRPSLWDTSSEIFKDRETKRKNWLQVARTVVPNFDKLNLKEKSSAGENLVFYYYVLENVSTFANDLCLKWTSPLFAMFPRF